MMRLSAAIITLNEAANLPECIRLLDFCDEVVVVDSGSTDNTVAVAQSLGARVVSRPFDDYAAQKNFAVSQCRGDWVLSIDADERVLQELRDEIRSTISTETPCDAYRIRRRTKLFGRFFRFSGMQHDRPIRLFRKGSGHFVQPIHEFFLSDGTIGDLKSSLMHLSTRTIEDEKRKTEAYTELEVRFIEEGARPLRPFEGSVRAAGIFAKRYFLDLGFLDGPAGAIFAFYSARYTWIKYRKARKRLCAQPLESAIKRRFDEHARFLPDEIDPRDRRLRALISALGDLKGKKILEVGCGKGRFVRQMARAGAFVTGVEPSDALLTEAVARGEGTFLNAGACDLPFPDGSFDAVCAIEVIEHLPDLDAALREMTRVLKPGGLLVLIDRHLWSFSQKRFLAPNVLIKTWHELKNDWMYPRGFPFRERWFTPGQVLRKLKTLGYYATAEHVLSDGEAACAWSGLFAEVPAARLFILWKGVRQ